MMKQTARCLFVFLLVASLLLVIPVSAQSTTASADPNATSTTANNITGTSVAAASSTTGSPLVVTTLSPATAAATTSRPRTDMIVDGLKNVTCPFARWQGDVRYCYECRWCPFRRETCCEMEDEISVLKSVNVSGSTDWDCFITIVHFQQCGRCDPNSRSYIMNKTLNYVWDPRGVAIRLCKQACRYIYKQCKDAKTLIGEPVVPAGQSEDAFCVDYPEHSTPGNPCFDSAGKISAVMSGVFLLLISIVAVAF